MYGTLRDTVSFINASPKRQALFEAAVRHTCPSTRRQRLKSMCDTRWVERHDAVDCFIELLEATVLALQHMARWRDTHTSCKAGPLLAAIRQPDFVAALCVTADVTAVTHSLSRQLQSETSDLSAATALLMDAKQVLLRKRKEADEAFHAAHEEIKKRLQDIGGTEGGKRARGATLDEGATAEDSYRVKMYIPFLDELISQLETRFSANEKTAMTLCRLIRSSPKQTESGWPRCSSSTNP